DYRRLRALADTHESFAVIGGGFIGSAIAAGLAMNGRKVTILFPEAGIGARISPADLSAFLVDYYREKGVEVLTGASLGGLDQANGQTRLQLSGGGASEQRSVDAVVAGLGIQPNVELAQAAGLPVENGVIVDETLH